MNNSKSDSFDVIAYILEPARDAAVLLGLVDRYHTAKTVIQKSFPKSDITYILKRIELPNQYAWLDILYINKSPAGSVLSVEISPGLYHMVGMYVAEAYRGKNFFNNSQKNYEEINLSKIPTPALFLLKNVLKHLSELNFQMTLEVMNFNTSACNLYEKEVYFDKKKLSFKVLGKENISKYAKIRNKKIGKWHSIKKGDEEIGGVQWSHVPDYNKQSTWSISRVYLFQNKDQNILWDQRKITYFKSQAKLLWTIIRYGSPLKYASWKLRQATKN